MITPRGSALGKYNRYSGTVTPWLQIMTFCEFEYSTMNNIAEKSISTHGHKMLQQIVKPDKIYRSWNEFLNQFWRPRGSSHRKTRSVTNLLGCGHKHPGRSQSLGILASLFIDPNLQWNYDAIPRPVGPFKWHSQLFELFFVWLPTWGYIIG